MDLPQNSKAEEPTGYSHDRGTYSSPTKRVINIRVSECIAESNSINRLPSHSIATAAAAPSIKTPPTFTPAVAPAAFEGDETGAALLVELGVPETVVTAVKDFTLFDDLDVEDVAFAYPVQLLEIADVVTFPLDVENTEEVDELALELELGLELELELEDEVELALLVVIVASIACTILASAEVIDAK